MSQKVELESIRLLLAIFILVALMGVNTATLQRVCTKNLTSGMMLLVRVEGARLGGSFELVVIELAIGAEQVHMAILVSAEALAWFAVP